MLQLRENEHVILATRKHWFIVARQVAAFVILVFVALLVTVFLDTIIAALSLDADIARPLIRFLVVLYLMILYGLFFLILMDFYLDITIITDQRVINIEQISLFNREVSDIPLTNIQDITIAVRGIIPTFLRFGDITIQTASERIFIIHNIPNLYEFKHIVLQYRSRTVKPS